MRRFLAGAASLLLVVVLASPAAAGGSWFDTTRASYEPGDEVTLVGYTGDGDWITAEQFEGWLIGEGVGAPPDPNVDPDFALNVGTVELERTGEGGWAAVRASITFTLPDDLPPGVYGFTHCYQDCGEQLGELLGGSVYVGVDNPRHSVSWPLSEPELANLESDVLVQGPGYQQTAGVLRGDAAPTTSTSTTSSTTTTSTTSSTTTSTTTSTSTTTTTTAAPVVDEEAEVAASADIMPRPPSSESSKLPITVIVSLIAASAIAWFAIGRRRTPATATN